MDLYYKQYGDGPPLVILHGLLGASGNWHTLSSTAFGEHFTVYAVDQRNHGRSPHSDVFGYPAMADDLRAFLEKHDLGAAHVLGHSMGGKTAMQLALTYPELVDRLVVVDIAPKAYPPEFGALFDALQTLDLDRFDTRRDADAALAEAVPSRPVRQFLLRNLDYDRDAEQYTWTINLDVLAEKHQNMTAAIEAEQPFRGPALFVRGEHSDYVAEADLPDIRRLFPEADLATIDGAGHWVHADAPQALAETVISFLVS